MRTVAVVGAALAGVRVVKGLRSNGFGGAITLIGDEPHLPYDRPPLSKGVLADNTGIDTLAYHARTWFDDNAIDLRLGESATHLDVDARLLTTDAGTVQFDDIVIASGARARNPFLDAPPGVFTLRTFDDAVRIRDAFNSAEHVVIIGGGFIGLEVASAARTRGTRVTVVELAKIPLSRNVGEDVAPTLGELARSHGVDLICERVVSAIEGGSRVERVVLDDGTAIACDAVIVGVGAIPNTEWLKNSGLDVGPAGVLCDSTGRAGPHVWAAGDVSVWRDSAGEPHRHEHWTSATEQARVVAHNIVDNGNRTVDSASFVWSDQFGKRISIVGDTTGHDTVRLLSAGTDDLAALYARDGILIGACVVDQLRLVLRSRKWVGAATLTSEIPEWDLADA
ncbi:NAD(P)/FAD-dependent oxidoreductase [Rhodococcus koreensis]|uniref:3-phenylpropionate/trans-cinnamate dioxygenase ferredoxin reductase subunit n=1 Tax=Rhodococcus koreensis TaxID=99653 RepID=A0A1H4L649_9NOCA|nr:FAD-dependent oxidoreductase [Rhodococcus koreensis]SEB66230.1 3-phenylpropionate/trans-cinnamate dioxygenase ferredoxin reductase subunit [Rhodococcus koreensis]